MVRSRTDIAKEIVAKLQPLKRPDLNVQPKVEACIAYLGRIKLRQCMSGRAIGRRAGKAREALTRLRDELARLPIAPPNVAFAPLVTVVRSIDYLDALDAALATLEATKALYPSAGDVEYMCAETARALIEGLSNNGTAEGPLRRIASRLYEAITGEPKDLKAACNAVLQSWRESGTCPS
jgi:hypothetical protein